MFLLFLKQTKFDPKSSKVILRNRFSATQNQRMNQIMKTLSVFSVVFIPLNFIVVVYDINFKFMPAVETQNGYYVTWLAMSAITICVVYTLSEKSGFKEKSKGNLFIFSSKIPAFPNLLLMI
jgi:magnesium transporter